MDTAKAKIIIENSFQNLVARGYRLYFELIQKDIVFNACLYILKNKDIHKADEYALAFTNAARELVEFYNDEYAADAGRQIKKNVEWSELRDYLQKYFLEQHGVYIEDH